MTAAAIHDVAIKIARRGSTRLSEVWGNTRVEEGAARR